MTDHKHISKLDKMAKARAMQDIQDILLTIVAQQGASVRIPMALAAATSETHRLKLERWVDEDGQEYMDLSVEKADIVITPQKPGFIM